MAENRVEAGDPGAAWAPRSAWAGFLQAGRHGRMTGEPGLRIAPREGLRLAAIVVGRDGAEAAGTRLAEALGLPLPEPRRASLGPDRGLVWTGPGQWLAVAEAAATLGSLAPALADLAAVTDQSDARAVLRVSGPRARDVLAKGFAIDLHPRAFPVGSAATTSVGGIGVQIWMSGAATYDIAVGRSLAGSFWSWLSASAASEGYAVI
ncbi:MAG TPA: sarcosine oxidase subunit gamma family protein [Methylobacterium sp.]|nr:sarcosine oxidase subunit gamma family protein [Methylobacterium sp.]